MKTTPTTKTVNVSDEVTYVAYGVERTNKVIGIGPRAGVLFLQGGGFLFPESVTKVTRAKKTEDA